MKKTPALWGGGWKVGWGGAMPKHRSAPLATGTLSGGLTGGSGISLR
jgi:hypothetical protein